MVIEKHFNSDTLYGMTAARNDQFDSFIII